MLRMGLRTDYTREMIAKCPTPTTRHPFQLAIRMRLQDVTVRHRSQSHRTVFAPPRSWNTGTRTSRTTRTTRSD